VECDRSSIRDIKAGEMLGRRYVAEPVASIPRQLTQSFALRAKDKGERKRQFGSFKRFGAFLGEPHPQEAGVAKSAQGLSQVADQNHRDDVEAAACCFGQRACQRRAMPLWHHDTHSPEGGCRAQDGSDILRIGDLVEHKKNPFGQQIFELDRGQGGRFEYNALMHGVRPNQPVELPWQGGLRPDAPRLQGFVEPPCGIFGGEQPADGPVRVGERGFYGVEPIQQNTVGLGWTPWLSRPSVGEAKPVWWLVLGA
jgi:hypothetical protein